MATKIATLGVERVHAGTYLNKAKQLCEAASAALAAERFDATIVLAIHAGISTADAVCIGLGTRKNKDAHERAAELLEQVGSGAPDFVDAAKRLRSLLAQKNAIEYENKRASRKDAELGVHRCESLVVWADAQLRTARLL